MLFLALLLVGGLAFFAFGIILTKNTRGDSTAGAIFTVLGTMILAFSIFKGAPRLIPTGLPARSIATGEYAVAFVNTFGENVNVGVKQDGKIYFFQFSIVVFDSNFVDTQAKKLLVVESDGFRKLVLSK